MRTQQFRIIKNVFFQKGEPQQSHYTVEVKCRIFGFEWWKILTEQCYDYRLGIRFESEEEAMTYIKKLVDNKTVEGWEVTTIKEFYCFPNLNNGGQIIATTNKTNNK